MFNELFIGSLSIRVFYTLRIAITNFLKINGMIESTNCSIVGSNQNICKIGI